MTPDVVLVPRIVHKHTEGDLVPSMVDIQGGFTTRLFLHTARSFHGLTGVETWCFRSLTLCLCLCGGLCFV